MTKLLDEAFEAARALSPTEQDEIARTILALAKLDPDQDEEEDVDPAVLPTLLERLKEVDEGRFASDDEVEATFRRFMK